MSERKENKNTTDYPMKENKNIDKKKYQLTLLFLRFQLPFGNLFENKADQTKSFR